MKYFEELYYYFN